MGYHLDSASPAEVKLIETTLEKSYMTPKTTRQFKGTVLRLIYDKAADSDPLRRRLKERGIELISPHKINRVKPKTQDGRKLRRYRRRWKMERTIAWIGNYRRLVTRYENNIHIYKGFFCIACMMITLNNLL